MNAFVNPPDNVRMLMERAGLRVGDVITAEAFNLVIRLSGCTHYAPTYACGEDVKAVVDHLAHCATASCEKP